MDGMHFDSLVRSLTSRPARRARFGDVVGTFGVNSLTGSAERAGLRANRRDRTEPVESCPAGRVLCEDACVSPWVFEHDAQNCGGCGNVCRHGAVCCDGACVDLTADAANCGACGARCAEGSFCAAGECI